MDSRVSFSIKNNSDRVIDIYAAYILPDTFLPINKPSLITIESKKLGYISDRYIGDDEFKRFSSKKLTIFILSKDTVDKYSWETIRHDYNILKRYEINNNDLVDMGGYVTYH
jgi:hypothetical protein